jgi:hypothetical protein
VTEIEAGHLRQSLAEHDHPADPGSIRWRSRASGVAKNPYVRELFGPELVPARSVCSQHFDGRTDTVKRSNQYSFFITRVAALVYQARRLACFHTVIAVNRGSFSNHFVVALTVSSS